MSCFAPPNFLLAARQLFQYRICRRAADGQLLDGKGQFGPFAAAGAESAILIEKTGYDLPFQHRTAELLIVPHREFRGARVIAHEADQRQIKLLDHLPERLQWERAAVEGKQTKKSQLYDRRPPPELAAPTLDMASALIEQFDRRLAAIDPEEEAFKRTPEVGMQDRSVFWR